MKSLITLEDKSPFQEFIPVFSSMMTSIGSDNNSNHLKAKERHPNVFTSLKNEPCVKEETGICLAVSLHDGAMLFISNTVNKFLGYNKNNLLGQCIFNYLYPQDRLTLANQLTEGLQSQFSDNNITRNQTEATFFCRMRQYHSLKCGFGVVDKKVKYKAFKFITYVKNLTTEDDTFCEGSAHSSCLVATLTPVTSAYKISEEIPPMSSFSTRHTADCHFSHIDSSSIPYLGYLPQDLLGFSIFDFYHVDDIPQLKDIYELVMKEQGNSFRSKPYRFKAFNGSYVFLETEWSCFINPWSKKLEFVVGQHRVLKGPTNINVFEDNSKEDSVVSDEILRESQRIQEEIKALLLQPVKGHSFEVVKPRCSKKLKVGFASLVSSLVDDMCQGRRVIEHRPMEQCSCSDHGSVVMGDISPHQEYGSDPSSVTPENSQEIRYKDNIERFFASQPKVYSSSDGSGEIKNENCQNDKNENCQQMCSMSCDESGKNSMGDSGNASMQAKSDTYLQIDFSQASSSKVGGSDSRHNYVSRNSLTEENLTKLNRLAQKHKQQQRKMKLGMNPNAQVRKETCLKRGCSPQLQENSKHKNSKVHIDPKQTNPECPVAGRNLPTTDRNSGQHTPVTPQQTSGYIPMGPFSLNPLCPPLVPAVSQASAMSWNTLPTSSYNIPGAYNSSAPTPGMPPQYCCMPNGNLTTSGLPTPFFMPVMCFGTMPVYPSLPTVLPQSNMGLWPSFIPQPQVSVQNFADQSCYTTNTSGPTIPSTINPANHLSHPAAPNSNVIGRKDKVSSQIKTNRNSDLLNGDMNSKRPITSFSGTVCNQTSTSFTQPKCDRVPTTHKTQVCVKMDEALVLRTERVQENASTSSNCSLLKSDCCSPSDRAEQELVKTGKDERVKGVRRMSKEPPWMEGLELTPDDVYRYQLSPRSLEDVLKEDLKLLKSLPQPQLVNTQLLLLQSELVVEARRISEDRSRKVDLSQPVDQSEIGTSKSLPTATDIKNEMDLGFATFEDDVGEETQAKEEEILHYICENM